MNDTIESALKEAVKAGYKGSTDSFFLAGHSLGGTCASTYTQAYNDKVLGNIMYGAYVEDQNVADWSKPVLTVGAELDGGMGRPGYILNSIRSSENWAKENGGIFGDSQMIIKPVIILPKLDHSDFSPGYRVAGDVYPSDVVTEVDSNTLIGLVTSNFLTLHTNTEDPYNEKAKDNIKHYAKWARENLLKPMIDAIDQLEGGVDGGKAPWCEIIQSELVGFLSEEDRERLSVISIYKNGSHPFEHTRVHYDTTESGSVFNISGHNQYYGSGATHLDVECLTPAHELGCKMASADRVAQQLQLPKGTYNDTLTCMDMNKFAYQTAIAYLKTTEAGINTFERFEAHGRPICFGPDYDAFGNIGPLWVSEAMTIEDDKKNKCLKVASLKEGPQALDSWIFPGVHYCKLLSPARVIDYMMIDSLKPESGCLNL